MQKIMNETASLPIPTVFGGAGLIINSRMPHRADETMKHSFDSDEFTTPILNSVQKMGVKKAVFINLCIRFASKQAFASLEDERKRHAQAFSREVEKIDKPPRKRPPDVP